MHTGKLLRVSLLLTLLFTSFFTKAQLVADFSATTESGCSPLVVRFTDLSTGNPTSWRWDLGNGTTSFLRNPSAVYLNPGKYTVSLTITNGSGEDSIFKTEMIEVYPKPIVRFGASAVTGCYPFPVQFTDSSVAGAGTIASWLWDFGDGATSTEQHPAHIYTSATNFNVTLQVKSSNGCVTTLTKTSLIQINTGVLANFTNDNTVTCTAPVTINFQNLSTGIGALNYLWDFGDGVTSTIVNPSHTYTSSGQFTVMLISTNSSGCSDTIIKTNVINVGTVRAGFTAPDSACAGTAVQFTNTSAPGPASVLWNFGDGTNAVDLSPNHIFTSAGNYPVKMIANFGACLDSVTKIFKVSQTPVADFSVSNPTGCKKPLSVTFVNQTRDAINYNWNLGNGTTSTQTSPITAYTAFGNFDVSLTATGSNGCSNTLVKANYISIVKPEINPINFPDSGCAPFTKTFNIDVTTADVVTGYLWNFGDGNSSTDAAPTNTFTAAGVYPVTVTITTASGCTDTARIIRAIVASSKPVPNFSATPTEACAKTSIQFTDLTTGGANRWLWSFGDNTTSTRKNPSKLYQDTGYFTVKLIVWNGGCVDSISFERYIHINPPVAKFNITSACLTPFKRIFTNQSIGADEWVWNFGDGTTSTDRSPEHTFASVGEFNVTLTVINQVSGCEHSTTKLVRILNTIAQFTASDTSICKGTSVLLTTPFNAPDIRSLTWSFGDSTAPEISAAGTTGINHTYAASGYYTIQLITMNLNNCRDTTIRTNYIKVDGPTAKFTSSMPGACINNDVIFNDNSLTDGTHPILQWKWSYGDSTSQTYTAPPFSHYYTNSGIYTVSLLVTDSEGCKDSIKVANALIISKPKAAFTSADTISCPGKTIRFTNLSIGSITRYSWFFGDDSTASLRNTSHEYLADGTYPVKLVVTDRYGCKDSILKINYIKISSPVSSFTMSDSVGTCPPLIVSFTNSSDNSTALKWDFGDSTYSTETNPIHFYNFPGEYYPSLTTTSAGGCTNTFKRKIVVSGPQGVFTYSPLTGCGPLTVNFKASTTNELNTFIWDFNDGSTLTTVDSIVSHTYTYAGRFIPKMILIDPAGCKVPFTGKDTIVVTGIGAKFSFDKSLVCDSGLVRFSDSSYAINDSITGYQWYFGDGNTSILQNPAHQYNSPGEYFPRLIARGRTGCDDTLVSTIPLKIVNAPSIEMRTSANGCAPLTVTFNSGLLRPDSSTISWRWDLANGNTDLTTTPANQTYSTAGLYTITLTGTNSSGCSDTVSRVIEAFAIPLVNAGDDKTLCDGRSLGLQATGAASYTWSPAIGLDCTNCASPSTTSADDISYIVTGTSIQGCISRDTVAISVKKKFVFRYSNSDSVCRGKSKNLSASGAASYEWSPSAGLSSTTISNPTATPVANTTYRVIGVDDKGCFQDTGFISLRVNPIPTVEAGDNITMNAGQSVDLIPVISNDVTTVIWQPTTGIFRNFYPGITVKPDQNTDFTVEVKNRGGCTARDRVTVFVICNGANLFVPNTFSPNADGVNDIFYPRGTGLFKVKELRIFNRWGELLFDKSNFDANQPAAGWDGTKRGVKQNADVFVYTLEVICDNGSVLVYRGNIALVK